MITSTLLARFFGILTVIVTLVYLFNRKDLDLVLKLFEKRIVVLVKGIANSALGVVLLLSHNTWMTNLDVITTLFCWLILIEGLVDLFLPHYVTSTVTYIRKNKRVGTITLGILLLLGVYLVYAGFTS